MNGIQLLMASSLLRIPSTIAVESSPVWARKDSIFAKSNYIVIDSEKELHLAQTLITLETKKEMWLYFKSKKSSWFDFNQIYFDLSSSDYGKVQVDVPSFSSYSSLKLTIESQWKIYSTNCSAEIHQLIISTVTYQMISEEKKLL